MTDEKRKKVDRAQIELSQIEREERERSQLDNVQTEENQTEEQLEVVSLEELEEVTEALNREEDAGQLINTKYTDGSTTNPADAQEQGLVYTPPSDPPVIPSDDPQGIEIAAGFAASMEESDPSAERFPQRIDNNDLDLEYDIATALRLNSETQHLHHVTAEVHNGIAYLRGTVESEEDIAIVGYLVSDLDGVVDVVDELSVR